MFGNIQSQCFIERYKQKNTLDFLFKKMIDSQRRYFYH